MIKYPVRKTVALPVILILFFALIPFILDGCKRKKEPDLQQKTDSSGKIGLRILYAGQRKTKRSKDFVKFLKRHFQQVETTDYNTFRGKHAADFDVAVIDYDGADTRAPRVIMSRQYARATVTVGVPGAFLCSDLSLKTGYL